MTIMEAATIDLVAVDKSRMVWACRRMLSGEAISRGIINSNPKLMITAKQLREMGLNSSKVDKIDNPAKNNNKSEACIIRAKIAASIWIREWEWAFRGRIRYKTECQSKGKNSEETSEIFLIITALNVIRRSHSGFLLIMAFTFA